MLETITHTLKTPIDVTVKSGNGENATIETINVKKVNIKAPKGKMLRKVMRLVNKVQADPENYTEGDVMMDAIQLMSDLPEGGIDEVYAEDIVALSKKVTPFLELITGAGASSVS